MLILRKSHKIDFSTLRLAVPDYASRQSFSSTTYTAPADGWVDIRATIAHGGDVVTLTTTIPSGGTVSWDARYFYPVKWS